MTIVAGSLRIFKVGQQLGSSVVADSPH